MSNINWQESLKDMPDWATHYMDGHGFHADTDGHIANIRAWRKLPSGELIAYPSGVMHKIPQAELDKFNASVAGANANEYKAAVRTLNKMGYTWNGGVEFKPPMGQPPEFIKPKVYTQQMADNKVLPEVGMVVLGWIAINGIYDWHEVEVLKKFEAECAVYLEAKGWLKFCDEFKPIDTRTEKEKVIDEIASDLGDYCPVDTHDRKKLATEIYDKFIKGGE